MSLGMITLGGCCHAVISLSSIMVFCVMPLSYFHMPWSRAGTDGRLAPSSQHACLQADTSRLPQKETTLPPCAPIQVEDIGNTSQQEASQKEPECAVVGAVEGRPPCKVTRPIGG